MDRRRGGIGTFLVGVGAFSLFPIPSVLFIACLQDAARVEGQIILGHFVVAIAVAVYAAKAFTRWRWRFLDAESNAKSAGAPPGSMPS